nr:Peptidase family M20/M25/M40 [uncultured bacterium]
MKHFIFIILLLTHSIAFAGLTPIEKNLQNYIQEQQSAQRALLKQLVNINSGTENPAGVRAVGDIMTTLFTEIGFHTQWFELPKRMGHAGTLIAERRGNKGKRILIIGHLDTVFKKGSQFQQYQVIANNEAKGPGITDDKGGLVTLLYALKALHAAHALENTNITVVLTGDEEDSGKPTTISRKPLIDAAKDADIALDFEPSFGLESVSIGRRGVSNWTIETYGKSAHSAGIFSETVGAGAIFEMARILNNLQQAFSHQKTVTFNPGFLLGGTELSYVKVRAEGQSFGKQNVVARKALVRGDMRFASKAQKDSLEARIKAVLKHNLPNTSARVAFEDAIPAMPETKESLKLLQDYNQASVALGYGKVSALSPSLRGAGDISHVAEIVPAKLAGLGPTGSGAHTAEERIALSSLPIQTERAAVLIYRLTR